MGGKEAMKRNPQERGGGCWSQGQIRVGRVRFKAEEAVTRFYTFCYQKIPVLTSPLFVLLHFIPILLFWFYLFMSSFPFFYRGMGVN